MKRTWALFLALVSAAAFGANCSGGSATITGNGDAGEGGSQGCGTAGQPCCNGTACDNGLACNAGTCAPACGAAGQACCNGTACDNGLACNAGMCAATIEAGGSSSSGSSSGSSGGSSSGSSSGMAGSSSGTGMEGGTDAGPCPAGLQCNVTCSNGSTTSISGKVYDPAGKNPLYGITVFVPAVPLQPLPKGVPTGADACSCGALYKSGMLASTRTAADGSFKLTNAPVGKNVPLVAQVGKWRRQFNVDVTACQDNAQPDKSLALPSTVSQPGDNMPDIAVSTGAADTLECLFHRVGLPASEYVAGMATTGHVHVFSGGNTGGTGLSGAPEMPPMPGAPSSPTTLWDSQAHLIPYDVLFLSCEGGETYAANPQVLENYLNAGGRVYASHYHYSWFAGPTESGQSYTAPADWGSNLAAWTAGSNGGTQSNDKVVQTLNGSTTAFPKGQAFYQWLGLVGALGVLGAPANELPVIPPRFNAMVAPANKPSQAWLTDDTTGNAMLFTFDTPVTAPAAPDGGPPAYCGRVAFGDLHVGGEIMPADAPPPPNGCTSADLSPQEKALEFMLFDLSSCVLPDSVAP